MSELEMGEIRLWHGEELHSIFLRKLALLPQQVLMLGTFEGLLIKHLKGALLNQKWIPILWVIVSLCCQAWWKEGLEVQSEISQ